MPDEIEASVREMLARAELYQKEVAAPLEYENLKFCLLTIPEPDIHERGYPVYLFYSAGRGHMNATREEMIEAIEAVNLKPGDTVMCAYRLNGPERPTCVSVSKVLTFHPDGKTPRTIVHFWPLRKPKKAIDCFRIDKLSIEDRRT